VDLAIAPDFAEGSADELCVLGQHSDGRVIVTIKDAVSRAIIREIWWDRDYTPLALSVVPDFNATGDPEIAVLGRETAGWLKTVQIKDSITRNTLITLTLRSNYNPLGMAVVPDFADSAADEIAVLAVHKSDDRVIVHVRDASTGATIRDTWFRKAYAPVDFEVMPDIGAGGAPEIAVLGQHADGRVIVTIKDAETGTVVKEVWWDQNYTPLDLAIIPDINDSGVPELAVLGIHKDTGAVSVQVKDAITRVNLGSTTYRGAYVPRILRAASR
jgi:uncharacterized FlaG/YvyC family protein